MKKITVEEVKATGLRSSKLEKVAALATELANIEQSVRSCDSFALWEAHPVVSQYLGLNDREIAAAIDLAYPEAK